MILFLWPNKIKLVAVLVVAPGLPELPGQLLQCYCCLFCFDDDNNDDEHKQQQQQDDDDEKSNNKRLRIDMIERI